MKSFVQFFVVCLLVWNCLVRAELEAAQTHKEQKKEFFILDTYNVGLFCVFMSVLGALSLYEQGNCAGVKVEFGQHGLYYDRAHGENWWNYYFEPINVGSEKNGRPVHTYNGPKGQDFACMTEFITSRDEAYRLIKKYIHVKKPIKKKVQDFVHTHFKGAKIIGVHYRGTDKHTEAPRASYETMLSHINRELNKLKKNKEEYKNAKIFIATDEQGFLNYIENIYPSRVIYVKNMKRSTDGIPVHFKHDHYEQGEESVIDCLLLSKCHTLIKTSSNLSLCSAYFNPQIPVTHVTKRPWRAPLE